MSNTERDRMVEVIRHKPSVSSTQLRKQYKISASIVTAFYLSAKREALKK